MAEKTVKELIEECCKLRDDYAKKGNNVPEIKEPSVSSGSFKFDPLKTKYYQDKNKKP